MAYKYEVKKYLDQYVVYEFGRKGYASRTVRRFNTQAEAMNYAQQLVEDDNWNRANGR